MNIFEGSRRIAKVTAADISTISLGTYAHEFWIARALAAKVHGRLRGSSYAE